MGRLFIRIPQTIMKFISLRVFILKKIVQLKRGN